MTVLGPSTRIAGRYDLHETLGSGPLGERWRAEDLQLNRPVALLLVHSQLAADEGFRAAFEAGARSWASISHPGATWVFDFGHHEEPAHDVPTVFLVRELVQGERLDAHVARRGQLPASAVLDVVAQAASTLWAAHAKGIVHGDVSPANLVLRADGVLKVTDFCVRRAVDGVPLTRAEIALNGVGHRSPEQAAGAPAMVASDIYGLGAVAYECLVGRSPFEAEGPVAAAVAQLTEPPPPLPPSVPRPAAALVMQMLDKDPARRPIDASGLAAAAVEACAELGGRTARPLRELLGGDAVRPR